MTERERRSLEDEVAAQQRGDRVEHDPVEATQEELRREREADASEHDTDRESDI